MQMLFFSKNLNHIRDLFKRNGKMRGWEDSTEKLGSDDKRKFIGDKLSTQSLLFGGKCL